MRAFVEQLGVLEAQESLTWVSRVQIGNGLGKRGVIQSVLSNWRRLAAKNERRKPMTLGTLFAMFGGRSVSVIREPKQREG